MNHRDINLISFFNNSIICFIINIYSDKQQTALKYLKDIKVNLNNVFVMTGNFNIKDNDGDITYYYHSVHTDTLMEIANFIDLRMSTPTIQVLT